MNCLSETNENILIRETCLFMSREKVIAFRVSEFDVAVLIGSRNRELKWTDHWHLNLWNGEEGLTYPNTWTPIFRGRVGALI